MIVKKGHDFRDVILLCMCHCPWSGELVAHADTLCSIIGEKNQTMSNQVPQNLQHWFNVRSLSINSACKSGRNHLSTPSLSIMFKI